MRFRHLSHKLRCLVKPADPAQKNCGIEQRTHVVPAKRNGGLQGSQRFVVATQRFKNLRQGNRCLGKIGIESQCFAKLTFRPLEFSQTEKRQPQIVVCAMLRRIQFQRLFVRRHGRGIGLPAVQSNAQIHVRLRRPGLSRYRGPKEAFGSRRIAASLGGNPRLDQRVRGAGLSDDPRPGSRYRYRAADQTFQPLPHGQTQLCAASGP